MDFLGSIGGITDLLLLIAEKVIGGYGVFHATTYAIMGLFRVINVKEKDYFEGSKTNDPNKPDIKYEIEI
jgi:hypothetical protein